jgi:hypothetical protein
VAVRIAIPTALRSFVDGQAALEIEAVAVDDAPHNLATQHGGNDSIIIVPSIAGGVA